MSVSTAPPLVSVPVAQLVPGMAPVPQVNLLPPEIRATRSLARLKRLLALLLVLVLVLVGAGFFWSTLQVAAANQALEEAQAETVRLLDAQKEFAEVPVVLADLEAAKNARIVGFSTEVLWEGTLVALALTAPAGAQFEQIAMLGDTPTTWSAPSTNPLVQERPVGTITFVGRAPTYTDTAAWAASLETIPGLADAYVTAVAIQEEDVDGAMTSYYQITGTVNVLESAYAGRFAPAEKES